MELKLEFEELYISGTGDIELQSKTVVPTKEEQVVAADDGYNALRQVTVLPIPEDYVNKNEVPKPTLNTPLISVNVSNAVLNVSDYRNGNFTTEYLLYRNGEQVNKFTSKSINLMEYMTVNGDETIQVRCAESEFFNESELSNGLVWGEITDGTAGLTYSGNQCTGIGTATATELYVASVVDGAVITSAAQRLFNGLDGKTVIFQDTFTSFSRWSFNSSINCTIVFGANTSSMGSESFQNMQNCILDFRKATKIPNVPSSFMMFGNSVFVVVVPDNLYEDWIVATNWTIIAGMIIRATDYEAQGGTV